MEPRIRLGVSQCLLGAAVRYNGGHKHDHYLTDTLGPYVEWVPVCPEVEAGLGVPREPMHLEGDPAQPRLVTVNTHRDLTGVMQAWAARRVRELAQEDLCGFVFKADSPSSGMERVKVYNGKGGLSGRAAGLFARAFMEQFPLLPVEEDGRLHDAGLRENFIERVFALSRYRAALARKRSVAALMAFHASHKLLIMSHSETDMRAMGRLLAGAAAGEAVAVSARYEALLLKALRMPATVKRHVNVIQHMLGYFRDRLSADEKRELLEVVEQYRQEYVPLIVPLTLVGHYARKYDVAHLEGQFYLRPHPVELKLRNHA